MKYYYKGFYSKEADCFCDIDIQDNVVIATELNGNPGTSITNAAEFLATSICHEFGIPLDRLIWIETYEAHSPQAYDLTTFDIVPFSFPYAHYESYPEGIKIALAHPKWRRLKDDELPKYNLCIN